MILGVSTHGFNTHAHKTGLYNPSGRTQRGFPYFPNFA
jgi:hypothetical protein